MNMQVQGLEKNTEFKVGSKVLVKHKAANGAIKLMKESIVSSETTHNVRVDGTSYSRHTTIQYGCASNEEYCFIELVAEVAEIQEQQEAPETVEIQAQLTEKKQEYNVVEESEKQTSLLLPKNTSLYCDLSSQTPENLPSLVEKSRFFDSLQEDAYYKVYPWEYLSNSAMSELKTPAHFDYFANKEKKETAALKFGKPFHLFVLEPEVFIKMYVVVDGNLNLKHNKEIIAEAEMMGKKIIKRDDMNRIIGMSESIRNHPFALELLENSYKEVSSFWTDKATGVKCKSRADMINTGHLFGAGTDLKSTICAEPSEFLRSIIKFAYHRQAAMYMRAFNLSDFYFIPVEKEPPYMCCVVKLSDELIRQGNKLVDEALIKFKEYRALNPNTIKPYYTNEVIVLGGGKKYGLDDLAALDDDEFLQI